MTDITSILHDFRSRLPMSLGYRVGWKSVSCAACQAQAYRGADRKLWIFDDEFMALGTSLRSEDPAARQRASLWQAYMDADDDRTLHRSAVVAADFALRFCRIGIDVEVIYAEAVDAPQRLVNPHADLWAQQLVRLCPYLAALADVCPPGVSDFKPLGFDIGWPDGRHSAIRNPGLVRVRPELPGCLNQHCLFPTAESALQFLDSANSMDYGLLPFCVLSVWASQTGVEQNRRP